MNTSRRTLAIALIIAAATTATTAAATHAVDTSQERPIGVDSKVELAIREEMSRQEAVGVAVGLISDGEVAWIGCFGWADRENEIPVTKDTMFRWASISKPLTAIAAAQLAETGKLDLDADVRTLVPEFPDKDVTVTTRQLLGHLGGVVHYTNGEVIRTEREYDEEHPYQDVVLALDTFKESPLVSEPGVAFAYTTHGFILASAAVQRAGGAPFHEQVDQRIARPLGLDTLQPDYQWKRIPDRAVGYRKGRSTRNRIVRSTDTDVSWKLGGGGFISNITDLATFAAALDDESFITPDMKAMLFTPQKTAKGKATRYGMGFGTARRDGTLVVSHTGAQEKTRGMLEVAPETGTGIVVLTNSEYVDIRDFVKAIRKAITETPERP
jgi:serine beta-lactamase-like protein LACTB